MSAQDLHRSPTLSLCIATLNRATYLSETLRGIAAQVTTDVEVVVLDGGSTDETPAVVESFRQELPLLRYERKLEPGGFDRDFDEAVIAASGRYCWLMSDDDLLHAGAVEAVLARLRQRDLSALIVNAAIYNEDFSSVLRARALESDDREYPPGDDQRLFVDAAQYLTFIGAVIVRRDLWLSRARTPYFGCLFIHAGVLFQAALPAAAMFLAEPLVAIRYGNASWRSRAFEIWMFKWPGLIWSFAQFSDDAKAAVCPRQPWRSGKKLLLHRAKGSYGVHEYKLWLKPIITSRLLRLKALTIALVPGVLCNLIAVCAVFVFYRGSRVTLHDLRKSRFNLVRRLAAIFSIAKPDSAGRSDIRTEKRLETVGASAITTEKP